MSLDSLLKPVEWIDEFLLKQYTKLAKRWEDNGKDIYSLSSRIGIPSFYAAISLGGLIPGTEAGCWLSIAVYMPDHIFNIAVHEYPSLRDDVAADTVSVNLFTHFCKTVNRYMRLPTFMVGSIWSVKAGYDLFNEIANDISVNYNPEAGLIMGLGLLGIASSQYLKDRDPKLLDKEPFWKTAYDWIREKVNSLVPEPVPQPNLLSVDLS